MQMKHTGNLTLYPFSNLLFIYLHFYTKEIRRDHFYEHIVYVNICHCILYDLQY